MDDCSTSPEQPRPGFTNTEANNSANDNKTSSSNNYNNSNNDNNSKKKKGRNNAKIEITPIIIIDYIISLNNDELKDIWDSVDKQGKNKLDLDHDFKKLLIAIVDKYISTKISGYDSHENHKYVVPTRKAANEINDDFEGILQVHGIYDDDYITKPFYMQNFQKYIIEIKNDNYDDQ